MCKQRVTHTVRADHLVAGEAAVILGRVRVVTRVRNAGARILVETADVEASYAPHRSITVHSEGEK